MKVVTLIGKSYCGKSEFAKVLEQQGWNVIHVGDLCRLQGKPLDYQFSPKEIAQVIDGAVIDRDRNSQFVIDNMFKTADGVSVIDYIKNLNVSKHNMIIYIIEDCRENVNFKLRGRKDDAYIQQKRKIWEENERDIIANLESRGYTMRVILNTDKGFLIPVEE